MEFAQEIPSTLYVFLTCVESLKILKTHAGSSQVYRALCYRWGSWGLHHDFFQ